ncbi:hypothetical protein LX36DRAFT_286898 [Colletotrichum falcatum]|nr:hypothetical protein LX36DRAFT_286898 [Colletotrichum falcatum]
MHGHCAWREHAAWGWGRILTPLQGVASLHNCAWVGIALCIYPSAQHGHRSSTATDVSVHITRCPVLHAQSIPADQP